MTPSTVCSLILTGICAAAQAQGPFDAFSSGANTGGWTFGGADESIPSTGGNPGGHFRCSLLGTGTPWVHCAPGSPFTGDYRLTGVTGFTIDITVLLTSMDAGPYPLTLILLNDGGTPGWAVDDWGAAYTGDTIPDAGAGWKRFEIAVPAAAAEMPEGWAFFRLGNMAPMSGEWPDLMGQVSGILLSFGDPELLYPYQLWTIGLDNIGLTAWSCYANCDHSTATPLLSANDFQCFLNSFAAGDIAANCDHSTTSPVLNANDFQCFLNAFAAGCS